MHPLSAKTHWPTGKRRAGLVILEEDDGEGNECSWCPVIESNEQGLEQVSHVYRLRGEKFHDGGEAEEALAAFARGAVTHPMNSSCWMGLAKVSSPREEAAHNCARSIRSNLSELDLLSAGCSLALGRVAAVLEKGVFNALRSYSQAVFTFFLISPRWLPESTVMTILHGGLCNMWYSSSISRQVSHH